MEFAVSVCFYDRGYWSKPYTYLHSAPVRPGDVVLVPKDRFYSVGKAKDCTDAAALQRLPGVKYKSIARVIEGLEK
jgi:hypothetical protein